jgi:WD40 repeat protein
VSHTQDSGGESVEDEGPPTPPPEDFDDSGVTIYSIGEGLRPRSALGETGRDVSSASTELSFAPALGWAEEQAESGSQSDAMEDGDGDGADDGADGGGALARKLQELSFTDAALKKIYAMAVSDEGKFLGAAGSDGRVAVYGLRDVVADPPQGAQSTEESAREIAPLLSFKNGRGWVSSLAFLEPSGHLSSGHHDDHGDHRRRNPLWLAVCGNDSNVHLWDCSKVGRSSGTPPLLSACSDAHTSGIFAMDANLVGPTPRLVTGGKDCGVGLLSVLNSGELKLDRAIADAHAGVVKSVAWRPGSRDFFLSGGNDYVVRLWDQRQVGSPSDFEGSGEMGHGNAINSVSWHPTDDNMFISAGNDPFILVWDARRQDGPVLKLDQHAQPRNGRIAGIYTPVVAAIHDRTFVVTGGEGTKRVTTYALSQEAVDTNQQQQQQQQQRQANTWSARVMSRGDLGTDVSNMCWDPKAKVLAVAKGRSVSLLQPVFQESATAPSASAAAENSG